MKVYGTAVVPEDGAVKNGFRLGVVVPGDCSHSTPSFACLVAGKRAVAGSCRHFSLSACIVNSPPSTSAKLSMKDHCCPTNFHNSTRACCGLGGLGLGGPELNSSIMGLRSNRLS